MAPVRFSSSRGGRFPVDRSLVQRVVAYLRGHPRALDTAEGIRTWWLSDAGALPVEKVQLALDYLVRRGVMNRKTLADGQTLYGAASPGAPDGEGGIEEDGNGSS